MSGLSSIPVIAEGFPTGQYQTENLRPLLRQLEQALHGLIEHDQPSVIDLSAMPFSESDERELRSILGEGEVTATIDAFGPTLLCETRVRGIWFVEYRDADQHRLAFHLEVARVPSLLLTPVADLEDGLKALRQTNRALSGASVEDLS